MTDRSASREWTAADAERQSERLEYFGYELAAELVRWQAARIAELEARPAIGDIVSEYARYHDRLIELEARPAVPASGQQELRERIADIVQEPSKRTIQDLYAKTDRIIALLAAPQQDVPDEWCRTFAESVVQQLADSEPTEEAIEGQEMLKGSIAETCFVVTGEELCSQIECAVSNAFYDGKIALLTPSPART